ncbi:MAG: class I SAM-dependent methyltransferase [Methanospirillum sp.]
MDDGGWDRDYRQRGRLYGGGARLPGIPDGASVLEIGCGDGRTLTALDLLRCTVVGLDRAPAALALCRPPSGRPPYLLVRGDGRRLPFCDRSFDAVLLLHVLGHGLLEERRSMAAEAVRVTAPGGCIHLRVFSREDLRATTGSEVEEGSRLRRTGVLTHYFSEDEVAALFPSCRLLRLETVRWHLRVRGAALPRAEIEAVFEPR